MSLANAAASARATTQHPRRRPLSTRPCPGSGPPARTWSSRVASSIGGLAPACSDHPVPELSPRPHRHHPAADRGQLPSRRPGSGSQAPDPGAAVPSAPTRLAQPCFNEHPQRTRPPARHHTQVHACAHIHTCVYRRAHARAYPSPPCQHSAPGQPGTHTGGMLPNAPRPGLCPWPSNLLPQDRPWRLSCSAHPTTAHTGLRPPTLPRPGPSLVSRPARLAPSANTPSPRPQVPRRRTSLQSRWLLPSHWPLRAGPGGRVAVSLLLTTASGSFW